MKQPSSSPISLADSDLDEAPDATPRLDQLEEAVHDLADAQKRLEERFSRLLGIVERLQGEAGDESAAAISPSATLPPPSPPPSLPRRAVRFVLRRVVGALRRLWQATDPAPPWDGEVRLVRGEKRAPPPRVARLRAGAASAAENCDYAWIVPPAAPEPTTGEIETVKLLLASEELGFVIYDPPSGDGEENAPCHFVVARELYDPELILDPVALERRLRHQPGRVVGKRVGASPWRLPPPLLGRDPWRELLRSSGPWLLPRSSTPRLFEHRLSPPARPTPSANARPGLIVLDVPLGEGLAATLARVLEAADEPSRPVLVDLGPQSGPAARRWRRLADLAPAYSLAGALEPELFPALIEHLARRHGAGRLIHAGGRESAARWRSLETPLELVELAMPPAREALASRARGDFFALHVALSDLVEDELRQRYPGAVIQRLEPLWSPTGATEEKRRQTVRQELGLEASKIALLWWGDFIAESRPEDFLGLARQRRDDSRFVFLMVGEGPLFGQLDDARRLLELENLRLRRPRHGLEELIAACDVACSTAERDVFGVAPRAAMAAGRPVIAASADLAPLLEADEPGSVAGIVLPRAGDLEAAGAALERLADPDFRRTLGEAGQARATRFPAPRESVAAWLEALGLAPEEGASPGGDG